MHCKYSVFGKNLIALVPEPLLVCDQTLRRAKLQNEKSLKSEYLSECRKSTQTFQLNSGIVLGFWEHFDHLFVSPVYRKKKAKNT